MTPITSPIKRRSCISRAVLDSLEPRRLFAVSQVGALPNFSVVSGAYPTIIDLTDKIKTDSISGTTVRFAIQYGSTSSTVDLELFDSATPLTVANFLKYVNAGKYNGSFFHRSVDDFVVQGGGYLFPGYSEIETYGTIPNEFSKSPRDSNGKVNTRGTIAMAKLDGKPDSADSEFYFNVTDNSSSLDLNNQNQGFTTFGKVLGNGMQVIDAINDLPNDYGLASPFDQLPLSGYTSGNSITSSNLVYVSTVAVVTPVTYTVTSSNLSLVNPRLNDDGTLVLTYQPNVVGSATIQIVATDLNGATLTTSFDVAVASGSNMSLTYANTRIEPSGTTPVSFGSVDATPGSSVTREFILRNTGDQTLTNLTYNLTAGFSLVGTAPTELISGESVTLQVSIPTDATGNKVGSFTINAPDSGTPVYTVPLSSTVRLPVTIGTNGVKSIVFTQGSTSATFTLSGSGTAIFSFAGNGLSSSVQKNKVVVSGDVSLDLITIASTDVKSSLKLATKGPDLINIGSVVASGSSSLNMFDAKRGRLTGSFSFGSTIATTALLKSLTFGEVTGARIAIGSNSSSGAALTFAAGTVNNSTLVVQYPVKSIKVNAWNGGDSDGAIQVASLKSLSIGSNFSTPVVVSGTLTTASIAGALTDGRWSLGGQLSKLTAASASNAFSIESSAVVNSATFKGDFSGSINAVGIGSISAATSTGMTLVAAGTDSGQGNIGKVTVKGDLVNAFINAKNQIGSVSANSLSISRIYAGASTASGSVFPGALSDFRSPSSIGSVNLTGRGVSVAFSESVISAQSIGNLRLLTVASSASTTNGIAADYIGKILARTDLNQYVVLAKVNTQSQVPTLFSSTGATSTFQVKML